MRVVVAAFGSELRGDDGFGLAVLRRMERRAATPPHVKLLEVGTAGLTLAQELLTPCDRLIVIDAMTRGGTPGTLYVLKVDDVPEARDLDMHAAVPAKALALARALDIEVIAEGIETESQRSALIGMACQFGQGYLLGRPHSASGGLPFEESNIFGG